MDFIYGDTILLGVCHAISESGLRGTFANAAVPGTKGLITLYKDELSFSAHALLLEVEGDEVTASFQFESPQEEAAIRDFLKLLSSTT